MRFKTDLNLSPVTFKHPEEPEPSKLAKGRYFIRRRFLFQWMEGQGEPWWIPVHNPETVSVSIFTSFTPAKCNNPYVDSQSSGTQFLKSSAAAAKISCLTCGKESPTIYNFGWVCTWSECAAFFVPVGRGDNNLTGYHPAFLISNEKSCTIKYPQLDVRPRPPVEPERQYTAEARISSESMRLADQVVWRETTTRCFWKGWWCSDCGKLSCR